MDKEKKISLTKGLTIGLAEIALILVALLFTTGVNIDNSILRISLGVMAMAAIVYLGLIGIESIGTERENVHISKENENLLNVMNKTDKIVDGIYKRMQTTEKKYEEAIQSIVKTMTVLTNIETRQNTTQKKK